MTVNSPASPRMLYSLQERAASDLQVSVFACYQAAVPVCAGVCACVMSSEPCKL